MKQFHETGPRGWDKSPSLSIVFGLSSKTQWLSGLYYADFISFHSPTQLCGGGTTKSNSNELPISVPLSLLLFLNKDLNSCLLPIEIRKSHSLPIRFVWLQGSWCKYVHPRQLSPLRLLSRLSRHCEG